MKKKLFLALLITGAALGAILHSPKPAHAGEIGDPCSSSSTGRSGYLVATDRSGIVCSADEAE